MSNQSHAITIELINWFSKAKRDLPWRQTSDPYKIWLSEIILQQTRVDQGTPYYLSFIENYPNVHALANASEDHVMRTWQGLGYYSRARNLHSTAKYISEDLGGQFPKTHLEIEKLKGVGPYTAAAIASIAYNEVVPVIDGNVFRFVSRLFGVYADIMKSGSRKAFLKILEELISQNQPGDFNQAMMEYGATVCTPKPHCDSCLFLQTCYAYKNNKQTELPVKVKKLKIKVRFLQFFIIGNQHHVLMRRRSESIWQGLYEFYLFESENEKYTVPDFLKKYGEEIKERYATKHLLTHQKLMIKFYELPQLTENDLRRLAKEGDLELIDRKEVLNLPKPKPIVNFLNEIEF
ncbi:MAG: A/G-specific adenine glycosylase [Cyclobacteriaceae bacterium]